MTQISNIKGEEIRNEFKKYSLEMALKASTGEIKFSQVEGLIADFWLNKIKERDAEVVKRINTLMSKSDSRASELEVSEDGYVAGLSDIIHLLTNKS